MNERRLPGVIIHITFLQPDHKTRNLLSLSFNFHSISLLSFFLCYKKTYMSNFQCPTKRIQSMDACTHSDMIKIQQLWQNLCVHPKKYDLNFHFIHKKNNNLLPVWFKMYLYKAMKTIRMIDLVAFKRHTNILFIFFFNIIKNHFS